MDISDVTRSGAPIPTTPSSTGPATQPAAPAPAPAAPQPSAWTAPSTTPAPQSRMEAAATKVKGKAVELVMDKSAQEHGLGQSFSLANASGNVRVSEELGLKGTDSYKKLVDVDRRRSDFAKANPDSVWVATKSVAGVSVGFPLGAGVSLGFNGGVEVSSIMAQRVKGASDVKAAVANQTKSMVLPLDAEGLQSLNPAPGSEWLFRGTAGSNVGAGVGSSARVGSGALSAGATLGVNVSASASATYTKNVKVLGDNKVFVQVSRVTSEGVGVSVGVTAAININAASVVAGPTGKLLDTVGDGVENKTRLNASASDTVSATQKVMGAAVLDLSTVAGREAYDYIVRSGPGEAAALIESQHLGVEYKETNGAGASGIALQFGASNLLSTSTVRGTTTGTVADAGGTTQLSEVTFGRSVSGFLPRLALGEERNVAVRAASITKNGTTQDGLALSLSVKDSKLTAEELSQLDRFAKGMGAPLSGLPSAEAGKSYGKADYAVQVALTDAQVQKMAPWGEKDLRLAFAAAAKDIDGSATLPPFYAEPQAFAWYKDQCSQISNSGAEGPDPKMNAIADYKEKYGRDLEKDLESASTVDHLVGQMMAKQGKHVSEWGGVLETLGKASSGDVRTAALAMRRLSGAEIVSLSVTMNGSTFAAKAAAAAPKTLGETVGPMLAPPV